MVDGGEEMLEELGYLPDCISIFFSSSAVPPSCSSAPSHAKETNAICQSLAEQTGYNPGTLSRLLVYSPQYMRADPTGRTAAASVWQKCVCATVAACGAVFLLSSSSTQAFLGMTRSSH